MKLIKNLIPYIVIIIVVVLVRSFIATPIKVNGTSMYPTLTGDEIMILNKLGEIDRFDIVVVDLKDKDSLIKRVIALPGESVEIKNNKIYVNNKEIKDEYGYGKTNDMSKIILEEDDYFVLGDNRPISLDSRIFGTINKEDIKGTTSFIMFPFKKIGIVN